MKTIAWIMTGVFAVSLIPFMLTILFMRIVLPKKIRYGTEKYLKEISEKAKQKYKQKEN
jgi:hypothetical protein